MLHFYITEYMPQSHIFVRLETMKSIIISILAFALFALPTYLNAQTCSFDTQQEEYRQDHPRKYDMARGMQALAVSQYRATHTGRNHIYTAPTSSTSNALVADNSCGTAKYILPVVVHIIHSATDTTVGTGGNISYAQIIDQLEQLNNAYTNAYPANSSDTVNTGIRFCLAQKRPDGTAFNGINRVQSTHSIHQRNQEDSLRALIHYPTDRYINIYVVTDIVSDTGSNGVVGYASYPYWGSRASDQIVIRHDYFGKYNGTLFPALQSASEGKVLAHEMGHYLGLFHPFEGGCIGLDSTDCATKGDMCCDVPAVVSDIEGGCNGNNTCFESYNNNPRDQKENYMDYSSPSCKHKFTADQAEVMYTALEGVRASLWQPATVNSTALSCCINSALFTGYTDGCNIDSQYLETYDYGSAAVYTWKFYKNNSLHTTSTYTGTPRMGLTLDSGLYDIELSIAASGIILTKRTDAAMTIYACDSLLPSTQGSWYFGQNAGMRFYANGLVLRDVEPFNKKLPSQINSFEGTVSMCDSMGDMLYYGGTDIGTNNYDLRIFDADYKEMVGSPISGYYTANQGVATMQVPGSDSLYYIFHMSNYVSGYQTAGYKYSIVDMSKKSTTQGEIVSKNVNIEISDISSIWSEGMTIAPSCSDDSSWLLIPSRLNISATGTSTYYSISVSIITGDTVKFHHNDTIGLDFNSGDEYSAIKVSPDGNFISYGPSVFSFCGKNGKITKIFEDNTPNLDVVYGCSFSPNSKLLYRSEYYRNGSGPIYESNIVQLDILSSNILDTKVTLVSYPFQAVFNLQLAPNQKIYAGNSLISEIANPDSKELGNNECGFYENSVSLATNGIGGTSFLGLPNQQDSKEYKTDSIAFDSRSITCFTKEFIPTHCCGTGYLWNFGDGNTSTLERPTHTYDSVGVYTITLTVGSLNDTNSIVIGLSDIELAISGPSVFCSSGDLLRYSVASSEQSYQFHWSVSGGSLLNPSTAPFADVSVQDSAWVGLTIYDPKSGCSDSTKLQVIKSDHIPKDFELNSTNCATFTFKTYHSCDSTYYWDFGDGTLDSTQNTVHTYQDTGNYAVQLISGRDTLSKTLYVGMLSSDLILSGASENCDDTAFYAYSVPHNPLHTYTWSSNGTKTYSETDNTATTKWATDGRIEVIIENVLTNCIDTVGLDVVKNLPELDFDFSSTNCKDVQFTTNYYCGLPVKWIFGDSTIGWKVPKTSTVQNPINTYPTGRIFYASLVVDGDTITKKIVVKQNYYTPGLKGLPSLICDTSEVFTVTIPEYNPNNTYTWSSLTDTAIQINDSMYFVKISKNYTTLELKIVNQNGCTSVSKVSSVVKTGLPFINPEITGDSTYCDTMIGISYSVPAYAYPHFWSVNNGNTLIPNSSPNQTDVKWSTSGTVKVVIFDPSSGCKDSATLDITKANFISDVLPLFQRVCENSDFVAFDGIPTGIDTSLLLLYQWYRGNNLITGATNRSFVPDSQLTVTGLYKRLAYTNTGCFTYSQDVGTETNERFNRIFFGNDIACFSGAPFIITGATPHNAMGTVSYSWQVSDDIITWSSTSVNTRDFNGFVSSQKKYYRRNAIYTPIWGSSICNTMSNIISIQQSVYIQEQPSDAYGCASNTGTWSASVKVSHPSNVAVSYSLLYKKIGPSNNWIPASIPSDSVSRYYGYPYNSGTPSHLDSFRFLITTSCGRIFSDIAVIRDISSVPTFTTHPSNQNVTIGTPATFSSNATMNSPDYSITWQIQLEGNSDWITIENSNSTTLNYTPMDICDHNAKFRMVAENNCGKGYSNTSILTVLDNSDIWFKDSEKDSLGLEPNPDSSHYDIVRSPDIWNRIHSDGLGDHQNMEFKNNSPNQLNLWVRNKGTAATQPTNLFLYWTIGTIGNEEWDARWLSTPANSMLNPTLSIKIPLGGRINSQTAPILVPSIAPGDSLQISYDWYPPNPAWFEGLVTYDARGVSICLLARLEHCEVYPHKMKIDEIFDQHVKINAINNNNIITKNTWVIDGDSSNLVDRDNDGDIDYIGGSWTGMGRQKDPSWFTKFCFDELSPSFFAHWNVAFEVQDVVRDAILANINYNPNVTYLGDNIFKFDEGANGKKCITQMILPDNELFFFRPLFFPANGWENLPPEVFEVGVAQYTSSGYVEGAGSFLLDNTDLALNNIEYVNTQNNSGEESNHLIASPNPTNNVFTLQLDEETKQNLVGEMGTIIVADAYGYPHVIQDNVSSQAITTIDLIGYQAGMYNVRFEIAGQVFYKYVVKTDE